MPSRARRTLALVALWMLIGGCAVREYHADTPSAYTTAANCIQSNHDNLYTTGGYAIRYLTIATGNPAFPPWWDGGTTEQHPEWKRNDPYLGRGFEGAMAFELAERLGFSADKVRFVPVGFRRSFAPGDKDFDFALEQIPYVRGREDGVDFSEGYYHVQQALVTVRGSPIATATRLGDLDDVRLGAVTGTAGLLYAEKDIRPTTPATSFEDVGAAVRALQRGDVDGIVVDLPTASSITRAPEGVLVGRLPAGGSPQRLVMALEKGSPIVDCVNLGLREMKDDGMLVELRRRWLAGTAEAPVLAR